MIDSEISKNLSIIPDVFICVYSLELACKEDNPMSRVANDNEIITHHRSVSSYTEQKWYFSVNENP